MRWWHVAALIVAVQYFAAMLIEPLSGIDYRLPLKGLLISAFYFSALTILGFAFVRLGYFAFVREPNPVSRFARDLLHSTQAPVALALFACQAAVLGWLKVMMPHLTGFWADPVLAELDASLFGRDPWIWVHMLNVGRAIDVIYAAWGFLVVITFAVLAVSPDSPRRSAAFISYFLVIGFSALFQYLLPAAGPIFYQQVGFGDRFADLPILPITQASADYLWSSYVGGAWKVGTGISAMPSVHVAAAAWVAMTASAFVPRLKVPSCLFVATIMFGSVYLGWHYAVDGIAGLAIALISWRAATWSPRHRRTIDSSNTVPSVAQ